MSPKRHIKRPKAAWQKKSHKGFQGYPIATVAYYGPDDKFALKVAVGILLSEQDRERAKIIPKAKPAPNAHFGKAVIGGRVS